MFNNEEEEHDHISHTEYTPMRKDAFELSAQEKQEAIQRHFAEIMQVLGLDMTDDSLKDTPHRVAKMYVNEIFGGLLPENKPQISTFKNSYKYRQMLIEKDITIYSTCEHHFLPIIGKAHVAYISNGKVIGLSKINRIVNYYARRPQVQERLTRQIVEAIKEALDTKDVACVIDARHLCVNSRGIKDYNSSTVTAELSGMFQTNPTTRKEFLHYIGIDSHFKI
ncbi:MAG: GTP cyclohydrolase I FolE [Flavobacteriaceae bacterium]|jgi:GTP cyclohydrolase I|nr:GTP cyclohydrolase I FolE [Flavobacteriaceae bacterium]